MPIDDWLKIFTYLARFSYAELDFRIKELQVKYGVQLNFVLEKIKYVVNFDSLIEILKKLKEQFFVDKMVFINNEIQDKMVVNTFCQKSKYRAVVFPNNEMVVPFRRCNFKTNGVVEHKMLNNEPFIVEEGDLVTKQKVRTLYIYDFNLQRMALSSQEVINSFNVESFKKMMLCQLIEDLCFLDKEVNVIFGNPNQLYWNDGNGTWNSDGDLNDFDEQILVQGANYLVRAEFEENEIKKIDFLVEEEYFKQVYEESSVDIKCLIVKLMYKNEKCVKGL